MVTSKLALSSLFHTKAKEEAPAPSPPRDPGAAHAWAWPSCKVPRTESFHAAPPPPGARTLASIFLDSGESSFTNSSARRGDDCSGSISTTASEASAVGGDDTAAVDDDADIVGGLLRSSDRLLFDPVASGATRSILEEKSVEAFAGGLAVAFESADPYRDFRASMEEMVASHGVESWGWLEEMLGWFLRANGEDTHAAIVAAFVDVIVSIADPARGGSCSSSQSSSRTFMDGE
ncbi:hypothetical protein QYE76_056672 [Lolium multiflorum]|uniref:Transcription repressor n=1 Tax=Lolium multiflorum TaxID=4521 RepID=A0AAD8WQ32_LOLMU|nr:hypothetical protein QYE76_056672 [Lolium multiflorum]